MRLSTVVKQRWDADKPGVRPRRSELQDLGNKMRLEATDPAILVSETLKTLETSKETFSRIVVDGVKNLGEIEYLKKRFGLRFFLFAIQCKQSERWERTRATNYEPFKLTDRDFNEENERDRDQEHVYGQQVQLCVDQSDVFIDNSDVGLATFREKVIEYAMLVIGETVRYARPDEILMNIAYSYAHGSKCMKRQVDAVIVQPEFMSDKAAGLLGVGQIAGLGFNENPTGTAPCVEEQKYGANHATMTMGSCFRDIVRHKSFVQHAESGTRCPACGNPLVLPISKVPPWRCSNCKTDLEKFFWPERAMTKCTAVHAEVQAIMAAGQKAIGSTLFSTTFPCFQCAEQIIHAGIKYIVYTETYPDFLGAERLEIAKVKMWRFEGVKSGRFHEVFSKTRPYISSLPK